MDHAVPQGDRRSRFEARLREVETELARLRGVRDTMVAAGRRARELAAALAADTVASTSDDGVATVSCDGRGHVDTVVFDRAGYNRIDEKQLCDSVLQARYRARDRARRESAALGRDLSRGDPGAATGV